MVKAQVEAVLKMPFAKISDYTFKVNPHTASWTYSLKINPIDTYGGRVVQILSRSIEGLSIAGYLSCKGVGEYRWKEMESFERSIIDIMNWQANNKRPVTFSFPPLSWTGQVYVTGYSDVKYDMESTAISYTLTMEVDDGFEGVSLSATDEGLSSIPDGVNWTRNKYNMPDQSASKDALDALRKMLEEEGTYGLSAGQKTYLDYLHEITAEKETAPSELPPSGPKALVGVEGSGVSAVVGGSSAAGAATAAASRIVSDPSQSNYSSIVGGN